MKKIIVGVDASRNKSGGAIDHIKGIINCFDRESHNIKEIHIWSYNELLNELPDNSWLKKHSNSYIESGIIKNLYWQKFLLKKELEYHDCDVLFSSDASSLCRFSPFVTLSQDALSFEKGTIRKFLFTRSIFRMLFIYFLQISTVRASKGTIFLTEYAKNLVIRKTGSISRTQIIPHGVNSIFKLNISHVKLSLLEPVSVIYVSNYSMYKNQWNVVQAVDQLNKEGYSINLALAGGGGGKAKKLTDSAMCNAKCPQNFHDLGRVQHSDLPKLIAKHDIFLFASSCETISITLLEGMASFKPIACSNKGPMPEVLGNNGVFFDPEDPFSIKLALKKIMLNSDSENYKLAFGAFERSKYFSWENCSRETWNFIEKTLEE
ncbi:glycosyltransferase [Parashewanella curva]|uniref:Glycosyltransferase n=1 Tax=Parashewanella curva TaxID=2338552 RepID=A0A3L8PYZ9_9GAMM|nr:glycosyltransferase [Parashewanella curva]RLV60390.1 glycosyltransferase [Parashewanella curva]